MNYYYFNELANHGIEVNLNFFGEKHGKFLRDQHFSIIAHYLKKESLKRKIENSTDIATIIMQSQQESNINRVKSEKKEIETFAFVLNPPK